MSSWTPLVTVHAASAFVALLIGSWVMLRAKKQPGLLRAKVTLAWLVLFAIATLTSFFIRDNSGDGSFSLFHLASIAAVVLLGVLTYAWLKNRTRLYTITLYITYILLVEEFVLATALRSRLIPQALIYDPVGIIVAVIVSLAVAVIVVQQSKG